MHFVIKPHKIRIVIDPKSGLNKVIKREHYPLWTVEEVTSIMPNGKYLAKFDASQGFNQICLDDASSDLCTFATPFGRYRYLPLPFRIKSAPEIYQHAMDWLIKGFESTHVVMDDVVFTAELYQLYTLSEIFLQHCRERNLRLNLSKFEFGSEEMKYIGHLLTKDGIKIDPDKAEGIMDMPAPKNVKELRRLVSQKKKL